MSAEARSEGLAADLDPEIALAGRLLGELRRKSSDGVGVTRASYGEGEQMAHDMMAALGADLDLERRIDAAGNLYLTLPGADRAQPVTMIGSHLDSVPQGGNYDGAAGVVAGMAVLARWRRAGRRPKRDIAVMCIRAEELSWFPAPYIGSRAAFGLLEPAVLEDCRRRDTGQTLAWHMREAGFDPEAIKRGEVQLVPERLHCFLELHIEQGPVLVRKDIPVGIVTGIRGNLRYAEGRVLGRYGHAGAEPREGRQDAVFSGVAFLARLHDLWLEYERAGRDIVCTVGQCFTDARVHTMTKIPGELRFTMDIRSQDNGLLIEIDRRLRAEAERIGREHGVSIDIGPFTNALPGPIAPSLRQRLVELASKLNISALEMASGAGHDSAVFGIKGVPTAMIFVRNDHGSHNPHEAMEIADFAQGLKLLVAAVEDIDERG